jgi:hypothetical protein
MPCPPLSISMQGLWGSHPAIKAAGSEHLGSFEYDSLAAARMHHASSGLQLIFA